MEEIKKTAEKIRKLEIQGATNVAVTSLGAVKGFAERHPGESIGKAADMLIETRPTEPLMINTLTYLKKTEAGRVAGGPSHLLTTY